MKKFLSITLALTMVLSVSATAVATSGKSDKNNGQNHWKNHNISIQEKFQESDATENEHGKKAENPKKAFKIELNERKKELQKQKNEVCAEKEQLESQYEELLASNETEKADALLEKIESLNIQINTMQAEIKKAINERHMVVKTLYTDEELTQFNNASELIAQMYQDAKTLDAGSVSVKNNIIKFDAPPYIKGGVTLIPVRAITEQLGCNVSWDGETETVTVTKDNRLIEITIDSTTVFVDGESIELNTAAEITCGRTFLPLRFLAESLGHDVTWDGDNQIIDVDDTKEGSEEDTSDKTTNSIDQDTPESSDSSETLPQVESSDEEI